MTEIENGCAEFYLLTGKFVRKLHLLEREEKICYGLTVPQCYTIEAIARNGAIAMSELSSEMGVAPSTVTRILDVLVRDEMVVRANEQSDRRRVSVSLTDKGSAFAEKLQKTSEKYCEKIFYNIPEENRQEVKKALQLLNQAVEKVKDRYKGM